MFFATSGKQDPHCNQVHFLVDQIFFLLPCHLLPVWANRNLAGPIVIGVAYGVSTLLTGGDAASDTADAGMSLAYGLLLWIGAPIALVAALPLLAGILKFFIKF